MTKKLVSLSVERNFKDYGELKSSKEIRLFAIDDLSIGYVFKIHSMTIVIKSLIEKDNKFYSEISLNHCSYEIQKYVGIR